GAGLQRPLVTASPGILPSLAALIATSSARVGPPRHPAWRSASLPPCHGPSPRDGLESGLHRSGSPDPSASRHSSVAPSTLEEAVNPESAKDCVRTIVDFLSIDGHLEQWSILPREGA